MFFYDASYQVPRETTVSGDGSYSNLDDYYLDDLHYLSDGSDGSVEI